MEFDLSGFPRETITENYLTSLETHVRFERTLKYVALPRLTVEASATSVTSPQTQSYVRHSHKHVTQADDEADTPLKISSVNRKDFADMTRLFEWLYRRHVRKIVKVTVIDNQSPCHKDATIVKCLKKFDVELWDWEKIDLSSEVICNSTRFVRQIWLHSTGNQAVLRGWCAPGGFGDRKKFPQVSALD